ncbi:unnamed protein product [Calypogeia fissa]
MPAQQALHTELVLCGEYIHALAVHTKGKYQWLVVKIPQQHGVAEISGMHLQWKIRDIFNSEFVDGFLTLVDAIIHLLQLGSCV